MNHYSATLVGEMTANRFAQLSLEDDSQANAKGASAISAADDVENKAKDSKKNGKKRNEDSKLKKRSLNFTWKVLNETSLNRTFPHGLVNRSNFCYLNAVLQPLLLCQPFVNIIGNMREQIQAVHTEQLKWLSAFLELIIAFETEQKGPVSPECVYRCWEHSDDQEDAEEFLRLILSGLHQELLKNQKRLNWTLPSLIEEFKVEKETVDDQWMSVGKGSRKATSRSLLEPSSPISVLFNGQFKSVVKGSGSKDSHVFEPFQFLPIDISENLNSIEEAIRNLMTIERISPKTTRQLLIERLPPILIIQQKRFTFDPNSMQIHKSFVHVDIPFELNMSDIVSNWSDSVFFENSDPPTYHLQSVVYHMGRSTHGGHYTCHVWHDEGWYYCDDLSVVRSPRERVGMTEKNKTPYLLFYVRKK